MDKTKGILSVGFFFEIAPMRPRIGCNVMGSYGIADSDLVKVRLAASVVVMISNDGIAKDGLRNICRYFF